MAVAVHADAAAVAITYHATFYGQNALDRWTTSRTRGGGLCVYLTDAWCSHTLRAVFQMSF